MQASNNQTNTNKSHEARPSLGNADEAEAFEAGWKTAERHNNINYPWVIVEFAGRNAEEIASEHRTFSDACKKLHRSYDDDDIEGMPVSIMRRNEDGTLTTEF